MGSQAVNQDSRNFHREMQAIISALKKFPSCFMEQDKCTLGTEERHRQRKIMNEERSAQRRWGNEESAAGAIKGECWVACRIQVGWGSWAGVRPRRVSDNQKREYWTSVAGKGNVRRLDSNVHQVSFWCKASCCVTHRCTEMKKKTCCNLTITRIHYFTVKYIERFKISWIRKKNRESSYVTNVLCV